MAVRFEDLPAHVQADPSVRRQLGLAPLPAARPKRRARPAGESEADFQAAIVELAKLHGWRVYHTHDSRRSDPGFPDLVLAHPRRGVLWREVKAANGVISAEQQEWLAVLVAAGEDAGVWWPGDWERIEAELSGAEGARRSA